MNNQSLVPYSKSNLHLDSLNDRKCIPKWLCITLRSVTHTLILGVLWALVSLRSFRTSRYCPKPLETEFQDNLMKNVPREKLFPTFCSVTHIQFVTEKKLKIFKIINFWFLLSTFFTRYRHFLLVYNLSWWLDSKVWFKITSEILLKKCYFWAWKMPKFEASYLRR